MSYVYEYIHMKHEGGTKDYDLLTITNISTNATVLMRKWGAIGRRGGSKFMLFDNPHRAKAYSGKIIDDKTQVGHGYRVDVASGFSGKVNELDEIKEKSGIIRKMMDMNSSEPGMKQLTNGQEPWKANESDSPAPKAKPAFKPPVEPERPKNWGSW